MTWNRDSRVVRLKEGRDGTVESVSNTLGEIYVVRSDGTDPVRLTHFAFVGSPDWGPGCSM